MDLCVDTMSTQQTFVTSELLEFCSLIRKVNTHEWYVPGVGGGQGVKVVPQGMSGDHLMSFAWAEVFFFFFFFFLGGGGGV